MYRARYSGMNKGEFNTIFSFFRSLRPLIEKFSPDICYFVLEGKPVKRLSVDSSYKAQRVYTDHDNFNEQRKKIISLVKSNFPIKVVKHDEYECDDLINYLANEVYKKENTTIISSDTDFIQSINETTFLYNPVKKTFIEKFEHDYVSWKSLVGDKSDNIEGFKGIGNKRARQLLESKEKFKEFLDNKNNKEKFEKNKFMIKFHDMINDKKDIQMLSKGNTQWKELKKEFTNMDFNSIIGKEKTWEKYINTFANLERKL
jgi:DNA polymerase-1